MLARVAMVVLVLAPTVASSQPSPRATLNDFVARVGSVLLETADPRQAWQQVQRLAGDLFDGQPAARRTLGPAWEQRTEAERAELSSMLGAVLSHAYLEIARARLPRDRPPELRVLGEDLTREGTATVRTSFEARDGSDVRLDYLMGSAAGRWRVQDVVIDGISMVENYRAQFARMVKTGSYGDAVERLRQLASSVTPAASTVVAYFGSGAANLSAAARVELDRMASWLVGHEDARVLVESHADQRGETVDNAALAARRATVVRRYLVDRGVADDRIGATVRGDRDPVCRGRSEACWAQNRRVIVRLAP
jgi:outer membrane protein OmpA-like peptidoglycan-associated protein